MFCSVRWLYTLYKCLSDVILCLTSSTIPFKLTDPKAFFHLALNKFEEIVQSISSRLKVPAQSWSSKQCQKLVEYIFTAPSIVRLESFLPQGLKNKQLLGRMEIYAPQFHTRLIGTGAGLNDLICVEFNGIQVLCGRRCGHLRVIKKFKTLWRHKLGSAINVWLVLLLIFR